jgi:Ca2+-binding EF-hand superfamily protein
MRALILHRSPSSRSSNTLEPEEMEIMRTTTILACIVLAPALVWAQPCTSDADSVVDAVYRQVLERPARGEGNARADQLRSGQISVREIVRDVAKSPEHLQRFLPANDRGQAVTNLYRHILGRGPDPAGLNSHVQGRDAVVNLVDTFIDSPEYLQKFGNDTVPGGSTRYCRGGDSSASNNGRNRFGNMDRNGNGVIEREEWNGNAAAFEERDWNHDGVLSGDELRPGARRSSRDGEASRAGEEFDPAIAATWTENAFRQTDRNRDGRITSSEWFYSADYFRRADRNRDGVLTMAEFTSNSPADDRDDRADSFDSLDVDHSGTLTPNEWKWTTRSFNRYDTDGDRLITRREFNAGGGAPSASR